MPAVSGQRYWRSNFYPYLSHSTGDGLWFALHYGRYSPVGFVERPEPNFASINLDAGASTQGSYAFLVDAQAPAWWAGWRAGLTLGAVRANRLGYYGLGNDTPYDRDSLTTAGSYFYKVSRTTWLARATVQRRVVGPLRILAGASVERTDFRALPGRNVFGKDLTAGVIDPGRIPFTDKVVRAGLVLDTRDNEIDPHRGIAAEALFATGTGYTRTTTSARVFVHPLRRLVLAGRLAAEGTGGNPPLAAMELMESSERPFVAVGGYHSLRAYYNGRFTGPGKLLGGLEARYAVLLMPSLVEVKLVAFYEAGRVFAPGEGVRLTTAGLHRAGGAEVAVRLLRNSLLVMGYGHGSDGGRFVFGTGWCY
ncbi:MAG TPA: BamA/TamA family outer membrane protein [Gemmatimonadales bacterium]|nr:BamA/TamA family outer membrane protein [Gemmatimonadales bacterium]